jgi:hypothetical protein
MIGKVDLCVNDIGEADVPRARTSAQSSHEQQVGYPAVGSDGLAALIATHDGV